ncbi:Copper metallochaperone, bacterial analog of Cox17 protein [Tritonibacter mobilis]|uniref:DUF1775 domain-containing protein n=1 Tax=Tritonibacter mobilis TaxID=379347 RepID=UPI000F6FBCD3|nr:DUF1775 domain-containing protein [Tritonibacter mobilis]VCU58647.1 Copper metallochaperone, bacterial analog of Cox17 protein [Tritonibacter mobilis]
MKTITIAGAFALMAGSALAHATLAEKEAQAGSTTKITLRVPHGCQGEATNKVRLTLPDGFYAAKPMPKAGWELQTQTGPYATAYNNHGREMTEGLREVIWSGGHLEDGWYDEFTVRGTIGKNIAPGTVLYFPTLQTCANGTADWTDVSGSHDVANPAPKVTVVAAAMDHGHGHGHGHQHSSSSGETVTLGALEISNPFSRATLPNAPVAGGFMTITNTGKAADRLIGAASDVAGHMEVHEMAMNGDVMQMRELKDGLEIPAGATVTLKPGSFHLMFMDLKEPLVEGETVSVTLTFEQAGDVTLPLSIGAINAKSHGGHMNHSGHGNHGDHGHGSK